VYMFLLEYWRYVLVLQYLYMYIEYKLLRIPVPMIT